MKHRRVKITGIGPVTPAGIGREAFARGICESVSRVSAVRVGEQGSPAAEVKDFRIGAFALDAVHWQSPREVQFALAATILALRDAGLALADVRKRRPFIALARPTLARANWFGPTGACVASKFKSHALQEAVAYLVEGRVCLSGEGESFSSLDTIGFAAARVASGEVDLAICGGADAPLNEKTLAELKKLGLSATHAQEPGRHCRPFDLWRTTGVVGEGACIFVLEPEESLRRAYACVAGAARVNDRDGQPWSGLAEGVRLAFGNAGIRPTEIECIHADGTGHKELDLAEANALRTVLGPKLSSIPVVAIKGAVGNTFGAAGAIQVGCAALGMKHSLLAPTVNWQHPDPSCPLNLSATPRLLATGVNLVTARDPGGIVSCLLLKP